MTTKDIDTFLSFSTYDFDNQRVEDMRSDMHLIRHEAETPEQWMRRCLTEIPRNNAEYLFVAFSCGTTMGIEAHEQEMEMN